MAHELLAFECGVIDFGIYDSLQNEYLMLELMQSGLLFVMQPNQHASKQANVT